MTIRQKMTRSLAAALLLAAVVTIVSGMQASGQPELAGERSGEDSAALPVAVLRVSKVAGVELSRTYTGVVKPRRTADIGFERSARLIELSVDDGDVVQCGDVLAQLDTRRLHARRAEIEARLDAARAMLDELVAGPRQETIAAAVAVVEDLTAQFELADRTYQRLQDLSDRNAVTPQSVDDASFARDSARSRLTAAQRQLEELQTGTRKERLAAQRATVAELQASLSDVEIAIDESRLYAPFTGRIASRMVDEGAVVQPGQPVFRIVEHQHLEARIGLPAEITDEMIEAATVTLDVNGRKWPAQFERALPEVDIATRTRVIVLAIDSSASDALVPGQIVRAEIARSAALEGYWLPTEALSPGVRGMWSAWAVVEADGQDVVERRMLEIVHVRGDRVLVQGTIADGDRIIAGGTQRVVPGQRVRVQE
jgi:multidrug efflux pump subunit AcrA (membrane-fusion protein)